MGVLITLKHVLSFLYCIAQIRVKRVSYFSTNIYMFSSYSLKNFLVQIQLCSS